MEDSMARMFTPDPAEPVKAAEEAPEKTAASAPTPEAPAEFEYVLGRRQFASVGLVILTGLAAFTALAYMVGKSSAAPAKEIPVAQAPASKPAPQATPSTASAVVTATVDASIADAPLAGTPETGRLYIQLAAVERGFATLMVHGARQLGFPAFVTQGTSPSIYRVLSGPFPDSDSYQKAKATFQAAGLEIFSRKYTESPETKEAAPAVSAAPATPTPDESAQP